MSSWVLGTKAVTNCTVVVLGELENMGVGEGGGQEGHCLCPQPICKAWHHFLMAFQAGREGVNMSQLEQLLFY